MNQIPFTHGSDSYNSYSNKDSSIQNFIGTHMTRFSY